MKIRTAIIPVAGLGTRFLPITKVVPKELLPLVDRPIIEYIIEEAKESGIRRIILVNSRGKSATEDYFDYEFDEVRFAHKKHLLERSHAIARDMEIMAVRQKRALGLGHAILCAKHLVENESFAVLLGDDVIDASPACTRQLIEVHEANGGAPVVGVMEVEKSEVNKYGIVGGTRMGDNLTLVDRLVEKPEPAHAPSQLAIPGRYILTPAIFPLLERATPGVGGEIQLTDALALLAKQTKLYAFRFKGQRFDAGHQLGFLEANLHYALKRPELREGSIALIRRLLEKSQ
jgi:UTP--glucose-1-phosphate uridylyltransferase